MLLAMFFDGIVRWWKEAGIAGRRWVCGGLNGSFRAAERRYTYCGRHREGAERWMSGEGEVLKACS